jgi:hypothetical protein
MSGVASQFLAGYVLDKTRAYRGISVISLIGVAGSAIWYVRAVCVPTLGVDVSHPGMRFVVLLMVYMTRLRTFLCV